MVYTYLEELNLELRGSSEFLEEEGCQVYIDYFKE